MKLPKMEYLLPESLDEACDIASREGGQARLIAGGTDLVPAMKCWLIKPRILIDLSQLADLNRLVYDHEQGLTIGALVTLHNLAAHPKVKEKYPLLCQAALSVGSPQLQAMGTIGGNVCQDSRCIYYNLPPMSRLGLAPCYKLDGETCHVIKGGKACVATYSGDMAPALMALQANVQVAGGNGAKTLPLKDLFSGQGKKPHVLEPGRIVTAIQIPPPSVQGGIYRKMRIRKSIDFPLLGAAVNLTMDREKNSIETIFLAMTAVEKAPLFIEQSAEGTDGGLEQRAEMLAEEAYKKAHPVANASGHSPRYRREMVKLYVKTAVIEAAEIASGRSLGK